MKFLVSIRPGPTSSERTKFALELGFRHFRVNFGRASAVDNFELVSDIHRESNGTAKIFIDLPGNKPRIGNIPIGEHHLGHGDMFSIKMTERPSDTDTAGMAISLTQPELLALVQPGNHVSLRDGAVKARVLSCEGEVLKCVVTKAGFICKDCGILAVEDYIGYTTLNEIDRSILEALPDFVFAVNVSFADSAAIICDIRNRITSSTKLFAKVETPTSVRSLPDLANVSDGLILARGDLRNFYTMDEISALSDHLYEIGKNFKKTIIFATRYFDAPAQGKALTAEESNILQEAYQKKAQYILINETASSEHWRHVLQTAANFGPEAFKTWPISPVRDKSDELKSAPAAPKSLTIPIG